MDVVRQDQRPQPPLIVHSRKTRRRRVAIFALLLVLAGAAAGVVRVKTYQPFEPAFGYGAGSQELAPTILATHNFGTEYVFRYTSGSEVRYGFILQNGGPFTVTVLGVEDKAVPSFEKGSFEPVYERNRNIGGIINARPLRNLVLQPNDHRYVELRYRFTTCSASPGDGSQGSGTSWATERIRFRVLGVTRTVEWRLPYGIALDGACGI